MKAAHIVALTFVALLAAACQTLIVFPELTFVSPLPAASETPRPTETPTETPTPTLTPRPSPTPAPTLAVGEPAVLALIPLHVGATWVYSVTLHYQDGYRPARWTGVVTETVAAARREGNARVFRVERTGAYPLKTAPHELTYFYVALGGWLYQLFDSEGSPDQIRDLIAAQGRGFEAERIAAWPMTVGQTWGDPHLISIEGGAYRWLVEAFEDVQMPANAGTTWLDCLRLVFRTNPDMTTHWNCPGVGLVRYRYHHRGSRHDEVWELLRYERASRQVEK